MKKYLLYQENYNGKKNINKFEKWISIVREFSSLKEALLFSDFYSKKHKDIVDNSHLYSEYIIVIDDAKNILNGQNFESMQHFSDFIDQNFPNLYFCFYWRLDWNGVDETKIKLIEKHWTVKKCNNEIETMKTNREKIFLQSWSTNTILIKSGMTF